MNFYNATVRLRGDTAHEVEKKALTAAEIMVLRRIHGLDAVVRVVAVPAPLGGPEWSHREERDRLRKLYCDKELTAGLVNELFGPDHIPLPATLDADEEVQAEVATRDRELKDTNKTTVTQEQLDALIARAVTSALDGAVGRPDVSAEPGSPTALAEDPVDSDAPDPATGRYPDHVIARNQAKGVAAASAKAAEKRIQA